MPEHKLGTTTSPPADPLSTRTWLTTEEAARHLCMSKARFYQFREANGIAKYPIGEGATPKMLYKREELDAALQRRRIDPAQVAETARRSLT